MDRPERTSVQPLKKLPYDVVKKELRELYPKETRKRLNFWASEVMAENRKKPVDDVKNCFKLFHKEWQMLIDILGYPEGYEKGFRG